MRAFLYLNPILIKADSCKNKQENFSQIGFHSSRISTIIYFALLIKASFYMDLYNPYSNRH